MPSVATTSRLAPDRLRSLAANDEPAVEGAGRSRRWPALGTDILSRLARLAAAANETEPGAGEAADIRRPGGGRNLCEFDYDYYVALQGRRKHQPTRLHRAGPAAGAR